MLFQAVCLGIEKEDLLGKWETRIDEKNEEGVLVRAREILTFLEDGTYTISSVYTSSVEGEPRLVTLIEDKSGKWSFKDKTLKQTLISTQLDFFSSSIPEMNRKSTDQALLSTLQQTVSSTFVSRDESSLTFANPTSGEKSTFHRYKNRHTELIADDPTTKNQAPDPEGEMRRYLTREFLAFDGFRPAKTLPTLTQRAGVSGKLRSKGEVLDRLLCNYVATMWVIMPEKALPSETIKTLIKRLKLSPQMTPYEKEVLETERAAAPQKFADSIGWKMESMNALAWSLGADIMLEVNQEMMGEVRMQAIGKFLEIVWINKDEFLKEIELKPLSEVLQAEDIFYCAHNAVRSAQGGAEKVVPEGFHPILNGGIIHEKRHVLTWLLSPNVKWGDTDLGT